jgi:hypothetical protein
MKVGIMQPYFFPYVGYFQLIASTDLFIFFDVVQYNKKSWMNRNRILHPNKPDEFQYISVPVVKNEKSILIKDVAIINNGKWQEKILNQLAVYKKLKAPNYDETVKLISKIFSKNEDKLLDLSISSIKIICEYVGLNFNYNVASKINFDEKSIIHPGDWALEISKNMNASEYINPEGGYDIFDEGKFILNNVKLSFLKSNLSPYKQSWRQNFLSGLSIIDILMFYNKNELMRLLTDDFKIFTKKELFFDNKVTTK